MDLKPIELPYTSLLGLSAKQISEHFDVLYKGYVNKVNDIRAKIVAANSEGANGTYAEIRELKLEESFALNAVKLHEAYFLGMGGDGQVTDKIKDLLAKDFGSYEKWQADFIATGMSARGWAVLYWDWREMHFSNALVDWHSHGGIWGTSPLLVLDVYEHAYFIDYGTKRKDYIDAWFKNVHWQFVQKLVTQIEKLK
jgi:superoxide dismutase, Fe-Mn family